MVGEIVPHKGHGDGEFCVELELEKDALDV
jgi:hypothetical protein